MDLVFDFRFERKIRHNPWGLLSPHQPPSSYGAGEDRKQAIQKYRKKIISKCATTSGQTALECQPEETKQCTKAYIIAGGEWFSYSLPAEFRECITAPDTNTKAMANKLAKDLVWVCDTVGSIAKPSDGPMMTADNNPETKQEMQQELKKLLEQEPDGDKRKKILYNFVDEKLKECMDEAANNAVSPQAAKYVHATNAYTKCRQSTDNDNVKECDFNAKEIAECFSGYIDYNCAITELDAKEA